jgi:hypothetical protein
MKAIDIQGDPGRNDSTLILAPLITQTLIGTTNTAIILGEIDPHGVCKLPTPQCISGDHFLKITRIHLSLVFGDRLRAALCDVTVM